MSVRSVLSLLVLWVATSACDQSSSTGSSPSPQPAGKHAPTKTASKELAPVENNSTLGEHVDGVALELRTFVSHVTADDGLALAMRFRSKKELGKGDPALEDALKLNETLENLSFEIARPGDETTTLVVGDTSTTPLTPRLFGVSTTLWLKSTGLSIGSAHSAILGGKELAWTPAPKSWLDKPGSYTLTISGEVVTGARTVKLSSGPLKFEVVAKTPEHKSVSELRDIASKLVQERHGLKAAPRVAAAAVQLEDGSRSFRFRLAGGGYDVTVVEVTLDAAGKEVLHDVYSHFTCVAEGTRIDTPSGPVPVEDLRVGMEVESYAPRQSERARATVLGIQTAHGERLLRLGDLVVTPGHPVFSDGNWVHAGELSSQSALLSNQLTRVALTPQPVEGAATVYNLSVSEPHTYFAGGLLVHNKAVHVPIGKMQPWRGLFFRRAAKR